ncbi:NXPE family member 2-like isoform X2 [Scleropages formosus]|uniref:NXPE family member 2-like isoform X2 n=1 Tax=Scleropages formosus TaxID=113540 RepID=UPI00087859D3|nr:NXPE family member 2-like isoform X2 [Scleropages formosus]
MLNKKKIAISHVYLFSASNSGSFFEEMTVDDVMFFLRWEFPMVSHWASVKDTSSASKSAASLEHPKPRYCVGENLDLLVEMRDHKGQLKRHGGDFILAWIHSPKLQASAAGLVTDLHNGSYRVRFTLFWPGEVKVSMLLMHPSEAVQALWRSRHPKYKKIKHTGTFVNGTKVEKSECEFHLDTNHPLCEYKDERDGEYYSCYKPPSLSCDTIDIMTSANTPGSLLTTDEQLLLTRTYSGKTIRNNFHDVHVVDCTEPQTSLKPTGKCIPGMKPLIPSGHFFKNVWYSSYCETGSFFSAESINSCLKGKRFYFMGDSTVHQWMQYLRKFQKDPESFQRGEVHPILIVNSEANYTALWKHHNFPWITKNKVRVKMAQYISRDLDSLEVEREEAVVVISVGQHFRAYSLEVFVRRLLNLRKAILRLQARSPGTWIFIKLENTRELSSEQERFSDWHGHIQNLAQRKVFGDLKVGFVDAWDMTVAANTFAIHPKEHIVANEVAVFLSYLCRAP